MPDIIDSSLATGSLCGTIVYFPPPIASDNCSYVVTQTDGSGLESGDVFPVGVTTIEYTATDPSGNTATTSFTVTITDDEYPVISDMPLGINQITDLGLCGAVVTWQAPLLSDNCIVDNVVQTHNIGDTFPTGVTTVIYTVSDSYGNTSTASFDVVITDTEDPTLLVSNQLVGFRNI